MRHILVLNAKGGSGKTTLATNLASYYAWEEERAVALVDYDPQGSSLAWGEARAPAWPPIAVHPGFERPFRPRKGTEIVIMDSPAGLHGRELAALVRKAETILVPVVPSPIDMRAAADFLAEIKANRRIAGKKAKVALVANRVREHTQIFQELQRFLKKHRVPVIGHLRESMVYIRAAEQGIGIFELPPHQTQVDWEQWQPILKWLRSRRSRP